MSVRMDIKDLQRRTMVRTTKTHKSNSGEEYRFVDYKHVNEVVGMILDYLGVEIEDAKPRLVKREES